MNDLNKHISLILKRLRKDRGWSLDKAAIETGVSKAMLGQIERQESSPTIATLWKIASGFNTSFSTFLEKLEGDPSEGIKRSNEISNIHPEDVKFKVTPLFPYDEETKSEIYIIKLIPGCQHLSPPHTHSVIEHVIVIEGDVEVFINNTWQKMQKHEGIQFNANQAHGYRNLSNEIAIIHNIIHYK